MFVLFIFVLTLAFTLAPVAISRALFRRHRLAAAKYHWPERTLRELKEGSVGSGAFRMQHLQWSAGKERGVGAPWLLHAVGWLAMPAILAGVLLILLTFVLGLSVTDMHGSFTAQFAIASAMLPLAVTATALLNCFSVSDMVLASEHYAKQGVKLGGWSVRAAIIASSLWAIEAALNIGPTVLLPIIPPCLLLVLAHTALAQFAVHQAAKEYAALAEARAETQALPMPINAALIPPTQSATAVPRDPASKQ